MRARARRCLFALLFAACSYSEETADITVQVNGIPPAADRLTATVTPSDASVQPKVYHPTFQPVDPAAGPRSLQLAFTKPAPAGSFTVKIDATNRDNAALATGTVSGTIPGQQDLQVTLQ
jgi:hypothetical protein